MAYVALTRARKKIQISYVNQNRYSYASHDFNVPSRFIGELPKDLIEFNDSKFVEQNDFLSNFIKNEDISSDYLTQEEKECLKTRQMILIGSLIKIYLLIMDLLIDDEVLHKKYGTGIILKKDIDKAEVNFENFGLKKIYLKFLQIKN